MVCDIAAGLWEELEGAAAGSELPSQLVLSRMHKRRKTGHENRTTQVLQEAGLTCPIPIDYVDTGNGVLHPIFRVQAYFRVLSLHNKLPLLLGHQANLALVEEYWTRFKAIYPEHPIFEYHKGREKFVIPVAFHADEGRTLKKSQVMVANLQPILGGNSSPEYDDEEMHHNFKFSTYCTRFLMFVMLKTVYRKSLDPFYKVLDSIAEELLELWQHGVDIFLKGRKLTLYVCLVAVKADWPLLAKLGRFQRFFGRKTRLLNAAAKGICHLCRAGQDNVPYHDYMANATWRASYLQDEPYDGNPPFSNLPWHNPLMYRFDIFHVGHKGVFAELAGSAIVRISVFCG